MKNRSKFEIVLQMLSIVADAGQIQKTKLMYGSFLSYRQFNEYNDFLLEKGLLVKDGSGNYYLLTEKGARLRAILHEAEKLMSQNLITTE